MASLTIRLLGTPEVSVGQWRLSFLTRKVLALLIYLVVEGGMHSRESLMALLWPESPPKNAAVNLRSTLSRLRKTLQPAGNYLDSEGDKVGFGGFCDLDLAWLATAVLPKTSPENLAAILELDRGEFLAGFSLPDAAEFDNWAAIQREACQRQVETVYDRLSQHQLANRESALAAETAARWVARAPYNEAAYRRLMAAQALAGDRSAALKSYNQLQAMLEREFSIEPARETAVLAEHISRDRVREELGDKLANGELAPVIPSSSESRSLSMPFVGRAEEHSRLVAVFGQAGEEGARVVTLVGAAGVGKTRLVEGFQEWVTLDSPGVEIWQGRAYETGGRLPYQAVIEAMRPRLEQENAPEDLLDDVWLAELSQLMPELRARYPDLPSPMTGDANFVRTRLFETLTTLGGSLVKNQPAIFILDDLQWADSETREMVHYMARRWAEMGEPIMLLLMVRQENFAADASLREWLTRLSRDVPMTRLLMDSLSSMAVEQLVGRLADPAADEEAIHAFGAWLWAETRGLPFFIEALLQMLVEQGVLTRGDERAGGYDFAAALHQVQSITKLPLPPGVREVILARQERLSEEAAALLLAGAVLGRECSFERLCQVAGVTELDALAAMETLLNGRLLLENSAAWRPYILAHDYIREVVYNESLEVLRRVFHRRALLALEADRAPAAECAFHALASRLDEPAFRFSLAAGDEALASLAFEESLVHYDRALEVAQRMQKAPAPIDPVSLRRLYQNRGRVLELAEDFPAAQKNYEEMREVGKKQRDQAMVLAALTAQCIIHATHTPVLNPTKARELGQAALELSQTLEDHAAEARALWGMMLVGIYGGGDSRSTAAYGQGSLSLARELGLNELKGHVLVNLCWPYIQQTKIKAALEANNEAQTIWQTLGNTPKLLETYEIRQFIHFVAGDHEGLLTAGEEVLRLSRLTGNKQYQSVALRFKGDLHRIQGQFGQALADINASVAITEATKNPVAKQADYHSLMLLYLYAGALDQAEYWADKLHRALLKSSMVAFLHYFLAGVAQAKMALGDLDEGQALIDQALEAYEWDAPWHNALIATSVANGYLQLALGRPEGVFEREERIQPLRQAGFQQFLPEALWLQGKAWLALGNMEQAKETLLKAQATAEEKNERTILWQILATLSAFESKYGNEAESEKFRQQANDIIDYIADHAGSDDLRASFLAQPEVIRVLNKH